MEGSQIIENHNSTTSKVNQGSRKQHHQEKPKKKSVYQQKKRKEDHNHNMQQFMKKRKRPSGDGPTKKNTRYPNLFYGNYFSCNNFGHRARKCKFFAIK